MCDVEKNKESESAGKQSTRNEKSRKIFLFSFIRVSDPRAKK